MKNNSPLQQRKKKRKGKKKKEKKAIEGLLNPIVTKVKVPPSPPPTPLKPYLQRPIKKTISSATAYDIKMAAEHAGTEEGKHYAYNAQAGEKDDSDIKHMGSFDVMSGVEGYGVPHSVAANKVSKHMKKF